MTFPEVLTLPPQDGFVEVEIDGERTYLFVGKQTNNSEIDIDSIVEAYLKGVNEA